MLERVFQAKLIKQLKVDFPGCVILKTDPDYRQGFPDLLMLYGRHWAALEVKRDAKAAHQPNQDYYVDKLNRMSFARFISPENEREVRNELRQTFGTGGDPCVSEPKPECVDKLHHGKADPEIFGAEGGGKGHAAA